jgi:formylglycine-generating enzyme required for sulfatase activity
MHILDNELRMVTAVDPLTPRDDDTAPSMPPGDTLYQLTHDYLVPSLRRWLTSKQRQTRRGRAELRLSTITTLWCDRPDSRRLPSLLEWLEILIFTRPRTWNTNSLRMMKRATRHFAIRALAAIGITAAIGFAVANTRGRERAFNSLQTARTADFSRLPRLLDDLSAHVSHLRPNLEQLEKADSSSPRDREVATLVLYRDQPTPERAKALRTWLLTAVPDEVRLIGDALAEHPAHSGLTDLHRLPLDDAAEPRARLRAACVLATLEPASVGELSAVAAPLAEALLSEDSRTLSRWIELLGPARTVLIPALSDICRGRGREGIAHRAAADAVAEILVRQDQPAELASLIVESTPDASQVLLRELVKLGSTDEPIAILRKVLDERPVNSSGEAGKDTLASRQASSAVALAALGQPESLWPLLRHRADPRIRTFLIERLALSTPTAKLLLDRLSQPDTDAVERQAILLALAEMPQGAQAKTLKSTVIARARVFYLEDPDPGVHSAAELVLRRWGEPEILEGLKSELESSSSNNSALGWAIGPNEHTFAILDGPLEFWMGSPPGKLDFYGAPTLHYRKIDRSIMVATKEVTLEQFKKYRPLHTNERRYGDSPQCAATRISWYAAAAYCNWLSERAGISRSQWCYPDNPRSGMTISEESVTRTGYRMPTEAEWEYFCRAGTNTAWLFGESPAPLSRFAWTWLNSGTQIHPPGQLLPNEFGLFDILGNAWEWCQDGTPGYYVQGESDMPRYPTGTRERPATDTPRSETVDAIDRAHETWRNLRGGAFAFSPDHARSAYREWQPSSDAREYLGLRVVRTLPPRNR